MKLLSYFAIAAILVVSSSCFDDREVLFTDTQIEFENAVLTAPASGQKFPIINLTRASGTPAYQVNLIGRQLTEEAEISFSLDEVPAALLNANTIEAVEGVHFTLSADGKFTFPTEASKTNFVGLTIDPAFPANTGKTALLVIKLDGNNEIKPAENFRRLGFRINLN